MTREGNENTKELIKDLCSRLPYGVYYNHTTYDEDLGDIEVAVKIYSINDDGYVKNCYDDETDYIDKVKPYLFPLSSMTEEMTEELNANGFFKYRDTLANVSHLISNGKITEEIYIYIDIESISYLIEFFHKHHIDYRDLIGKSLALDATGLNIY